MRGVLFFFGTKEYMAQTQTERIAKLEHAVHGNGYKGLKHRVENIETKYEKQERRQQRIELIMIATLAAAFIGGIDGVMYLVRMVFEGLL